MMFPCGFDLARITSAQTRSISAENPDGSKGGGARALPPPNPSDDWCTPAARDLGQGWKVRPCARDIRPGQRLVLADIEGPGVVQHIWCTVLENVHRWVSLRIFYDDSPAPSVITPLGDFFANGLDGLALVNSLPIAVNPRGGMNSYWPMPFRRRIRIEVANDGPGPIPELFYQISYSLQDVPPDAGYLHASWRRAATSRDHPQHTLLDITNARGHYIGTYLVWGQLSSGWWGEGEMKFFIDGDAPDGPTICGTGTEDYFGGAWGFARSKHDQRPRTFSTAFLGYPQAIRAGPERGRRPDATPLGPPVHALYRWHIPDPVRFSSSLRACIQALGWWPTGTYQPLADDIASVAYWYQSLPAPPLPDLGPLSARLPR